MSLTTRLLLLSVKTIRFSPSCSMYQHPYLERFKKQRDGVSSDFYKKSTGLTGLLVDENPRHNLRIVYNRIIKVLKKMPEFYVYRKNTLEIVNERLNYVEQEPDLIELEKKIGMGQLEEVLVQAEYELQASRELLNSKAWETLPIEPSKTQWLWPIQ